MPGFSLQVIALLLMVPVTLYYELRDGKIYNWLTVPAVVLGLLLGVLEGAFMYYFWGMLIAGGVFFLPYLISGLAQGRPVIGGGDVKFAAAVGALGGPAFALWTLYYAVLIGGAMGVLQIAQNIYRSFQKKRAAAAEPTVATDSEGEPLAAAPAATEAPGTHLWLKRIPFGTALCCGVLLAFYKTHFPAELPQ